MATKDRNLNLLLMYWVITLLDISYSDIATKVSKNIQNQIE